MIGSGYISYMHPFKHKVGRFSKNKSVNSGKSSLYYALLNTSQTVMLCELRSLSVC